MTASPPRRPAGFGSDNVAAISPAILAAIAAANEGSAPSYGADEISMRVEARLRELFECDLAVALVSTGTAANALALSLLTPPFGAVLCHPHSHVENDECGAPEFFTGGAKLAHVPGESGLIDPEALAEAAQKGRGDVHCVQPACVSITQASERGTLYTPAHIRAIGEVCRSAGLGLHMDGSRFANAVAGLGASPADLTWKGGVDVLSFGATKNGAMGVEAVIVFDPSRAAELGLRRKRAGHLTSKMRFLAAQMQAYLEDGLWLANARHANAMASRLATGLAQLTDVRLSEPVEANILFVTLPDAMLERLRRHGFTFYTDRLQPNLARLVTSFQTTAEDVDYLLEVART